jgi:hypothetical protein
MNAQRRGYKKIAASGEWSALVHAESEAEVRTLHEHELRLLPGLAQQYPGPFTVEALPQEFEPPPILEALEDRGFAKAEELLGIQLGQQESEGKHAPDGE